MYLGSGTMWYIQFVINHRLILVVMIIQGGQKKNWHGEVPIFAHIRLRLSHFPSFKRLAKGALVSWSLALGNRVIFFFQK